VYVKHDVFLLLYFLCSSSKDLKYMYVFFIKNKLTHQNEDYRRFYM